MRFTDRGRTVLAVLTLTLGPALLVLADHLLPR